ncbi:hypothetical protein GCM10009122_09030 [Fulvivirga kasyanovii]|uniref:T9SS C-terminal target domain-containing protein n=1 Tax=Fulvivirga kasyanovii TaxID=396812 RepID=A0ABW9S0U4_9BACT|nr:FG-GAP-like repeat-containing protein [Fulvivirga kasyanovii]MTI29090.1 hypothetical protein [Fulvivirga kasyanovii]
MKNIILSCLLLIIVVDVWAGGEPSTYFNIFVPPNNDPVQRNVALIVTAISDSTYFTISDDNMDGDSDDNITGWLMAGQSYILYIKDNGVNDDALYASGGELKSDGDYYTITGSELVYASMSTDSDWQHDFVPSINKKSVGEKFIVYAPKNSNSPRDLNVFAYHDNTTITISKISQSATTTTGYTDVNIHERTIVTQRTLNRGEDIIHYFQDGRDIMITGETYIIEANSSISVQYGALWNNARDGGAYVPSYNGSAAGELFYFAVPYQSQGEQEIRIVSWDANNDVSLERYDNGSWVNMNSWNLSSLAPVDWVGKQNSNATYNTVFRVTCSAGKRVSVFEANWMETGYTSTSDMATMVSSGNGTTSGTTFLTYMLPPGNESNVINPFTGETFSDSYTHFYLFAGSKNSTVTIKDAKTNGEVINRTYNIDANRYADAFFSIAEWQSIYNGDGSSSGPERPYVLIEASTNIAVLSTNFNDNWMTYFGSSLPHGFNQIGSISSSSAAPGDTITLASQLQVSSSTIENPDVEIRVSSGTIPLESIITNTSNNETYEGSISYEENGSRVTFDSIPNVTSQDAYQVETTLIISAGYNDGAPIANETVITVETIVTGEIDGQLQQSILSQGIENNSEDASNLFFSSCGSEAVEAAFTNSWNGAWVDYNNDGWEDLMATDKDEDVANYIFRNDGSSFTSISNTITTDKAKSAASIWADINNDGLADVLVINATQKKSMLYLNTGTGFAELANSGLDVHPTHSHGAAFADFNNDGFVDLLVTNLFETKFHQLYRNNGDETFTPITNTSLTAVTGRAMAPILADYNNDGLTDVFIPNGNDQPNALFKNLGAFQFEQITSGSIVNDNSNSVGAAWGDYDNDGYQDLFVANASDQHNALYHNNGDGTFTKVTHSVVVTDKGHSHGSAWVDVDNDADLDLFVTNDQGANFLYINDGKGSFTRKLDEIIASNTGNAYGTAWADQNKDGFQDAIIFTHGGDKNRLFCNNGNGNNWINIKLIGTYSNRSALGARVEVKANDQWQTRQVLPVSGFGSQHSMRAHFGIGTAGSVDSLIVYWPSGHRQTLTAELAVNTFITIMEEEANILYGITFNDENGNGQRDPGEKGIGNIPISVSPLGTTSSSDHDGIFSFNLPQDAYIISAMNVNYWNAPTSVIASFDGATDSLFVEIPLEAQAAGFDLSVNLVTTAWRRGFPNSTSAQIVNKGTSTAYAPILSIGYPQEVSVLSSDQPYLSNDTLYTWSLSDIAPGEVLHVAIEDSVTLNAYTGQFLTLSGNIDADGEDLNVTDNSYSEAIEVVGAIDPNDILVTPRGEGDQHYVAGDESLTYTVRFQNVGTYHATYVIIENQLSALLDIQSFEVVSSSHAYSYELSRDGRLLVKFHHINLPYAEFSEQESQGYFRYRIKPAGNLMGGERIANSAEISFDFEAPIITNEVYNTVKYKGSRGIKELTVYPNPATDRVEITVDRRYYEFDATPAINSYDIKDPAGRVVRSETHLNNYKVTISLKNIPPGMYLIQALDHMNHTYVARLIIR